MKIIYKKTTRTTTRQPEPKPTNNKRKCKKMEAIKQIKKEFHPTVKNENENITTEYWNVTTAEATTPGNTDPVILTPAVIENHFNGEEIPQLTKAIDSLTEWYICDYFHYNDYLLVDSDIKVYLTSYYRRDDWKDNLKLETNSNYNILLDKLPADAPDYFNIKSYDYTPYYNDEGDDALDFLTWTILEDNADGDHFKDIITDKNITAAIRQQTPEHQEIIRTANYQELFQDIKTAYNKIIKEYLQESQEALYNNFYDEIYYPNQEAAELNIIRDYINTPIKDVI